MKFSATIIQLSLFPLLVAGVYQGTEKEFLATIESGIVPEGVLPDLLPEGSDNLRKLQDEELRKPGERCGSRRPCEEGNDCVLSGFGRLCMPKDCIQSATEEFIQEEGLEDYPERVMAMSGNLGKQALNTTAGTQEGWAAVMENSQYMLNRDFKNSIVATMTANPPNMTKFLGDVLRKCPAAATKEGVTLMLGMHYELAAVLPKFMNSYYFAIGTGDINVVVDGTADTVTGDLTVDFEYEATGGVYSDVCGGVGPDVGFDLGLTFGAAFTGTVDDLPDCAFAFDIDAGAVTAFGASVMVTSSKCITKLMFTTGWGLGGGIGFSGCTTYELSKITF